MRPNRIRYAVMFVAAFIGVFVGAAIGTGVARADDILTDAEAVYTARYADAICWVLDDHPTVEGVMVVGEAVSADGWADHNVADIVNAAVYHNCYRHWGLLTAIGNAARAAQGEAGYMA